MPSWSGLNGFYCDEPDRIADTWRAALASDRPCIVEFRADPDVPPLPPHITLKDARNFMTMMRDEPNLGSVIANSARQLFARVLSNGE